MVEFGFYASHIGRKAVIAIITVRITSFFLPASGDCFISY